MLRSQEGEEVCVCVCVCVCEAGGGYGLTWEAGQGHERRRRMWQWAQEESVWGVLAISHLNISFAYSKLNKHIIIYITSSSL